MKNYLIRHLGNMGDLVFLVPPILHQIKDQYPDSHITFITAWGYKNKKGQWGQRNQGGHGIHLMMTNPHINQLIHWHDTKTSLDGSYCQEDGQSFPTWSKSHYEKEKSSKKYDQVIELDVGLERDQNPLVKLHQLASLTGTPYTNYQIHLTDSDKKVAAEVMTDAPRPRIVIVESFATPSTRSWDTGKIPELTRKIVDQYGVKPIWFGSKYPRYYRGRELTLRENIATLTHCDACIGTMSGPLHFAAAVGLPTLSLYCDEPIERAAPAHFLNPYIESDNKLHRTLLGPSPAQAQSLKYQAQVPGLTKKETKDQHFKHFLNPGKQSTKSCLAVITADEIMAVLEDMVPSS